MEPVSLCPIRSAVEVLGDRWTLLILRDVIFEDRRHFRALLTGSSEGIASNILADRLVKLVDAGLLVRGTAARGQRARYSLTESGIDVVPVVCALGRWGLRWGQSAGPARIGMEALRDGGPDSEEQLMNELRTRHLTTSPSTSHPSPASPGFMSSESAEGAPS